MADDVIDLSARRAAKLKKVEPTLDETRMDGYRIAWSPDGRVMIVFVTEDQEYTAIIDHDAARRFGKRVEIAALRAKRCQDSPSSAK